MNNSFGKLLQEYLQDQQLTQDEIAARSKISQAYVNYLLNGKRIPTMAAAKKLAKGLNLTGNERKHFLFVAEDCLSQIVKWQSLYGDHVNHVIRNLLRSPRNR